MLPWTSSIVISLSTYRAGVGLHPCMDSKVIVRGDCLGEGLVTGGAGKGLIACVCPLVTLQIPRLRKSLANLGAGKRNIFIVNSYVNHPVL